VKRTRGDLLAQIARFRILPLHEQDLVQRAVDADADRHSVESLNRAEPGEIT